MAKIEINMQELINEVKTALINKYNLIPNDETVEEVLSSTAFLKTLATTLADTIYKTTASQKIISEKKEFKNGFCLLKTRKIQFVEIREKLINENYHLCTKSELAAFVKNNPDELFRNRIVSLAEKEITPLGHLVYPTIVHSRRPEGNKHSTVHMLSKNSGYRILVKKK